MSKADDVIDAITNKSSGIDANDVSKLGLEMNEFYSIKSKINNTRGTIKNKNKKFANIQIIRAGKKGRSVWKFAQESPKETLEFTHQRVKRERNSLLNSVQATGIAIANELDLRERLKLSAIANQQLAERVQLLNAV